MHTIGETVLVEEPEFVACPKCGGTGSLSLWLMDANNVLYSHGFYPCDECHGRKRVQTLTEIKVKATVETIFETRRLVTYHVKSSVTGQFHSFSEEKK